MESQECRVVRHNILSELVQPAPQCKHAEPLETTLTDLAHRKPALDARSQAAVRTAGGIGAEAHGESGSNQDLVTAPQRRFKEGKRAHVPGSFHGVVVRPEWQW